MATGTIQVKDGNNAIIYLGTAIGAGSSGSPYQPQSCPGDGTNAFYSGSATNLLATSGVNSMLATKPGMWTKFHAPAANTKATITKAAGAAGVSHVCTALSFTVGSDGSAPTAQAFTVNLRDGATGAGTILASWSVAIPAVAGTSTSIALSDLNIPGTAATAMTIEFTAAGDTHTTESVQLFGYDTQ